MKSPTQDSSVLTVQVKDSNTGNAVQSAKVTVNKLSKLSDDSGLAHFPRVSAGKVRVTISHPELEFDHMQFHGKSHTENEIVVKPKEHLEVIAYLKGDEPAFALDKIVAEESPDYMPDLSASAAIGCSSASIAAAMHALRDVQQEMDDVLDEPKSMRERLERLEEKMIFSGYRDPTQLAIRIQEHLNLPKFAHEHSMAPLMWEKCLKLSEALAPFVSSRDALLKVARENVAKLAEYADFVKNQEFIELAITDLKNCEHESAVETLQRVSAHLRTMKMIVQSTKEKLQRIENYSSKIDSPERLGWILEIVGDI